MTDSQLQDMKGFCPECHGIRYAKTAAEYNRHDSDEHSDVSIATNYRILECCGCKTVYFRTAEQFSEDWDTREHPLTGEVESYIPTKITYWPAPSKREEPSWNHELIAIDRILSELFNDIYTALNNDLRVLAAIGIRTLFDRAATLLKIDSDLSFKKKLDALQSSGKIGSEEKAILDVLTDAGSAAAHRGWRPHPKELDTMMSIIEQFIYRTFVLGEETKRLRSSVPSRSKS